MLVFAMLLGSTFWLSTTLASLFSFRDSPLVERRLSICPLAFAETAISSCSLFTPLTKVVLRFEESVDVAEPEKVLLIREDLLSEEQGELACEFAQIIEPLLVDH